ncbi:hypothetical protein A5707_04310 [Mycobacterium kyorinense]|uniref:DUF4832 domain-containing protein n=1 Tax=Mycobacterium kyorinense TaxID=487514 RepID=A0A1A2Z2C6_9MYCO|nr:hypothetical protein [Mycobacterium kyorinense]OBI43803.1 hypothetical protein A5707_04310 [Mycobacterium kyorinense]
MIRRIRDITGVVVVCAVLAAMGGCGAARRDGPLAATSAPPIPHTVQEMANPLRGQYEDLLKPLFPQSNPAQRRYRPWPTSYDASLRVSWRQLQPTDPNTLGPDAPDDLKYDFSLIDDTLAQLAGRGVRLTLRVYSYNSCCDAVYPDNTNVAIPDWVRGLPGTTTTYPASTSGPGAQAVTQVVPNWNSPEYLAGFEQLLAALGRRYDRDERLSVFEFSGYGDFSENHNAYLRDALGTPGPTPEDSITALGYFSQFRDQNVTKASIQRLVTANVDAFPHTQLVVTPQNPEIVRELFADDVTEKLAAPVGIRSDCLGVYAPLPVWAESDKSYYVQSDDPLVNRFRERLSAAPVITEWCQLPAGTNPKDYYQKGLSDVVKYHVSMTSSINFPDAAASAAMDPALYALWWKANVFAGYRYSVEARSGSETLRNGVASIAVGWTNHGSAAATEKWVPGYRLIDSSGAVIRMLPSTVTLQTLVGDHSGDEPVPASTTESVDVEVAGLAPGHYTLQAAVGWQQHKPGASHVVDYPPMQLARDGRDSSGWYPVASVDIPISALSTATNP